jgi:hypothetical protein
MLYASGAILVIFSLAVLPTAISVSWNIELVPMQLGLLGLAWAIRARASDAFRQDSTAVGHRLIRAFLACSVASHAIGILLMVMVFSKLWL